MQHLGRVRCIEQGTSFGVALAQQRVADFVVLVLRRVCLKLGYAALYILIVSNNLRYSQRPSFVDCRGVQQTSLVTSDPDSRPSAMVLVLVKVTVWLGIIEWNVDFSPGSDGPKPAL